MQESVVTIVCTSSAVAGQVVLLLLERSLFPRTHFRVDQTDRDKITITVMHTQADAPLRAELAAIDGVSIQ
jgi:hypothetical protein